MRAFNTERFICRAIERDSHLLGLDYSCHSVKKPGRLGPARRQTLADSRNAKALFPVGPTSLTQEGGERGLSRETFTATEETRPPRARLLTDPPGEGIFAFLRSSMVRHE